MKFSLKNNKKDTQRKKQALNSALVFFNNNMKKAILIFLIFISISKFYGFNNDIKFRLIVDFWSNPFFYENSYNIYGVSINGSLMCGARIKKFTIGAEVYENYFSLTGQNDTKKLVGAWNIVRGTINGYFTPIKWFELKWGLGGAWYSSTFDLNDTRRIGKDEGGISFVLNAMFRPWKYMRIDIINNLDIFISQTNVTPYYLGGVRLVFYPFIDILNLYIETTGMPWIYNGEPVDIRTGMFFWGAGIALDISFPYELNIKKREIKFKNKIVKNKEIKEGSEIKKPKNEIREDLKGDKIEELRQAQEGDVVVFTDIIFYPNSDEFKEESIPALDSIAIVLIEREDIRVEIRGHTNYTGAPRAEIDLSKARAGRVREYMVFKGVNARRMKILGYGGLYTEDDDVVEANRRVEIKVLRIGMF